MRKIGVYGGTFDPVHHAHLILAREALEQLELEKVIFVPAAASPLKSEPTATGEMRLSMLRAAIADEPKFVVDDCELRRPAPSFTIDTIVEMRSREGDAEIYYLVGDDNVETFPKWHRFAELEKLVRIVVLDRTGAEMKHDHQTIHRKIDISATEIRKRVAFGQSIRYLVPAAVAEIIEQANLYREPGK